MPRRRSNAADNSNILAIRAPPHLELCLGYNGVPATNPRLRGIVEVRAPGGVPIPLVYITISLRARESIAYVQPGRSGLAQAVGAANQRYNHDRVVGKEILLWQVSSGVREGYAEVLSMDIPFVFPLAQQDEVEWMQQADLPNTQQSKGAAPPAPLQPPGRVIDRLPATLSHPSRSTTYELVATLHSANAPAQRSAIEVILERFDTLPSWGMFRRPLRAVTRGTDHVLEIEATLTRRCVGPGESVVVDVHVRGNPDWPEKASKVKIDHLSLSVEQEVRARVEEFQEPLVRTKRVAKARLDMSGLKLGDQANGSTGGVHQRISVQMPGGALGQRSATAAADIDNPIISNTDLRTSVNLQQEGYLDADPSTVAGATQNFTTRAFLYDVDFVVRLKVAVRGAKDVWVSMPIVVSQYGSNEAESILDAVEQAVYEAYDDPPFVPGVDGDITVEWAAKRVSGPGGIPRPPESPSKRVLMD
ncbi:hypothetical protein PYCC9005_005921 [Savitreella phatthalungensis]